MVDEWRLSERSFCLHEIADFTESSVRLLLEVVMSAVVIETRSSIYIQHPSISSVTLRVFLEF